VNLWPIVVRKNSTTLMQRGPRGCTRGEVRSIQDAPQLGLIGRNDASDVAHARGDLGADGAGRGPKKSEVGLDYNALARSAGFFDHRPRLTAKIAQNSLFAILACPSASRPTS